MNDKARSMDEDGAIAIANLFADVEHLKAMNDRKTSQITSLIDCVEKLNRIDDQRIDEIKELMDRTELLTGCHEEAARTQQSFLEALQELGRRIQSLQEKINATLN